MFDWVLNTPLSPPALQMKKLLLKNMKNRNQNKDPQDL